MINQTQTIEDALEKLSSKQHVVSNAAVQANKDRQSRISTAERLGPQLDAFNHSVDLLVHLFRASHLDEMAQFIAHPARVLVLNFLIGIVRGIGFLAGVILLLFFLQGLFSDMPFLGLLGIK